MESKLRKLIDRVVEKYAKEKAFDLPADFVFDLHVTKDPAHGDFATNLAFKLARILKTKPAQVAGELVLKIQEQSPKQGKQSILDRAEMAGAGFINFHLKKASLAEILTEVRHKGERYGQSDFGEGRKAIVEFVSANPTGPMTIAHGRQAAVGDAIVRILKATGHKVTAEYYLNDAGRQMRVLGQSLWARYCEEFQMEAEFPEDGYKGEYLRELAKLLVTEVGDELLEKEATEAVEFCQKYATTQMMELIKQDLDRARVVFDHYFSERTLYEKDAVTEVLESLRSKNYLYEKEGALWFASTQFGDDKDRVVRKSTGEYTYLAPDIAYHWNKFERGFQWIINLWGPDHHGYIPRLKAACQALGHSPQDIAIRIVQLTTLFRNGQPVRMSTRAGEFVTFKELMDEVGVDAARFFFIMRRVESPLDFDLDLAKEKSQDNPVYYLQYAHARIVSVLKFSGQGVDANARLELLNSEQEIELIKLISEFPKVLIQASQMLEPQRLAEYLRELAASFHKFYTVHRVVTEDQEITRARLLLVDAVRITLRNGLGILGISQPESM